MSESNNTIACVVVLVDSSLLVLSEWTEICGNYIRTLITRLYESYKPRPVRIACVCYASASTRPNPLLSRTSFMGVQEMTTPLARNPQRFGVGQTGTGSQGMAVLEGLVAAIELFDALKEVSTNMTPRCHIVHIAASNPDGAERPLWNTSSVLDAVTWDTLPAEFRKRAINYSLIAVRPSQKLVDFFNTVASGSAQNVWFETKPSHVVSLTGFPPAPKPSQPASNQPSPAKRSVEAGSSPETKRMRLPSKGSPSVKSSPIPKPSEPRQTESPAQSAVIQSATTTPHALAAVPNTTTGQQGDHPMPSAEGSAAMMDKVYSKLHQAKRGVQNQEQEVAAAERSGDHARLAEARQRLERANIFYKELNQRIMNIIGPAKQRNEAGLSTNPPENTQLSPPNLPSSDGPSSSPSKSAPTPVAITSHSRTPSQSQPPPPQVPMVPSAAPPQLVAQMQKLVDQRNRTPRMSAGSIPPQEHPAPSGVQAGTGRLPPEWTGFLTWKGTDPMSGQRRELRTWVELNPVRPTENVKIISWPPLITLNPSASNVPDTNQLQEWVTRHNGVVVMLRPAAFADPKTNEDNFRTLIRMLAEKTIFALASWPGPDGQLKNQLVLFSYKDSLAGVYFPDGVPELPKAQQQQPQQPQQTQPPQPPPPSQAQQLNAARLGLQAALQRMSPTQRAQLNALPPPQREAALRTLLTTFAQNKRTQSQMMPQQQPGVSISGSVPGQPVGQTMGQPGMAMNVGNPFAGRPPAMFPTGQPMQPGQMQGTPNMMGFTPQQMAMGGLSFNGMHNRTPSGGSNPMANVSAGMLQSFMQRNPDPSNPGM